MQGRFSDTKLSIILQMRPMRRRKHTVPPTEIHFFSYLCKMRFARRGAQKYYYYKP